jgi:hypothetical protein
LLQGDRVGFHLPRGWQDELSKAEVATMFNQLMEGFCSSAQKKVQRCHSDWVAVEIF